MEGIKAAEECSKLTQDAYISSVPGGIHYCCTFYGSGSCRRMPMLELIIIVLRGQPSPVVSLIRVVLQEEGRHQLPSSPSCSC